MQTKTKAKRWTSRRHNFIILLAALFLYPWTKLKSHVKVTPCKELRRRQCLVIMNHQTVFDQFFVSFALFPRHVYFISSDEHFSLGFLSKLLTWAVAPIPIKKQLTDPKAVMNCIRVAREGGTIALAPEGNRTFSGLPCHINPAISSLVKKLNLPLAIFRIEGGYGIQPRWSEVCRKGKMHAYVKRIIEPEEYQSLSKDALYELIKTELYVDETQNPGPFRHKKLAEGLEHHGDVILHASADGSLEVLRDGFLNDENHLVKACALCIEHRVVDDEVTILVDRLHLLHTAEARTHTCCQNYESHT